jgi:hypothetical protein
MYGKVRIYVIILIYQYGLEQGDILSQMLSNFALENDIQKVQLGLKLKGTKVNLLEDNIHKKLRGLSPQANYTDRATAACQRS